MPSIFTISEQDQIKQKMEQIESLQRSVRLQVYGVEPHKWERHDRRVTIRHQIKVMKLLCADVLKMMRETEANEHKPV